MPRDDMVVAEKQAGRPCTLFYHPGAGERNWSPERIVEALRQAGFDPCLSIQGEDDWRAAMAAERDLVIVAGGDGSISYAASLIGDRDLPLAVLPTGSGNNIARSLGILAPLEQIIPRLRTARTGPLRLCRARGQWGERHFVEGVGLGALAHSVRELQDEELDGAEKLIRGRDSLTSSIEAQEPLSLMLKVDGQLVEGDFLLVEVLNLSMIGPNIRFLSDTALKGENVSVALLHGRDRDAFIAWLASGGTGVAPVRHVQGRRVTFEGAPQPLLLEDKARDWDGSRVEIEAIPHRVRVLRPGDSR